MTTPLPESPSLESVLDGIWATLAEGCARSRDPLHTATIATLRDAAPRVRTVVLQHVDRSTGTLGFHTDVRAPKAEDLAATPVLEWHFYDRSRKTQIRARAEATLHTDDEIADQAWAGTPPLARRCYGQALGPGQAAEGPDVALPSLVGLEGDDDDIIRACRENFCVVRTRVTEIDWLYLRFAGHRRAHFERDGDAWAGRWLAP